MKKYTVLLLFFLLFANAAGAYTFNQSLSIGSSNEGVHQLQIFLNNYSPSTQVASYGAGSPGNETSYFGNLTKQALIKFQNINKTEILTPVGLSYGTGYFGPSTIKFVNGPSVNTPNTIENQTTETTQKINSNTSFLLLSTNTVASDDSIFVGSTEAIDKINFYLGDEKLDSNCRHQNSCEIKIDNVKAGDYILRTDNPNIRTENIKVLNKNDKPEINIKTIKLGSENYISGKNLTSTVTVYTPFGYTQTQTKDNAFNLEFNTSLSEVPESLKKGPFYVKNNDGVTSDIIIVNYEI